MKSNQPSKQLFSYLQILRKQKWQFFLFFICFSFNHNLKEKRYFVSNVSTQYSLFLKEGKLLSCLASYKKAKTTVASTSAVDPQHLKVKDIGQDQQTDYQNNCVTNSTQKISEFHRFISDTWQILEFRGLKDHTKDENRTYSYPWKFFSLYFPERP